MMKIISQITRATIVLMMLTLTSCISCKEDTPKEEITYSLYQVNIKSSLNVRMEPASNSRKIGALYNNDKVNVININNGWAKIKFGSQYAYVSSKYLTLIENKSSNDSINKEITSNKTIFFDNANLLSNEEYAFINQAYANINAYIIVWTTESIDKGDIIHYNEQIIDKLEEEPYDSKIKASKPSNIDEDDIYFITYIKNLGLLQVKSESGAMNIINISMPEKYIQTQIKAKQNGLKDGLIALSSLINEATIKYNENNWFIRTFINGSSLGEMITESLFKEQIVPSNSFFHKYIFSWATKIPRDFVNYLIAIFGSLSYVMIFLCILYTTTIIIKSNILGEGYKQGETKKLLYLLLSIVVLSFLFVSLIILIFYTMCNLADITAMNMYGWNNEMSTTLLEHNLNDKISRSWWLSLLFFIGMFMYKLPDAWVTVAAFLPPKVQQQLAKNNPSHFNENMDLTSKESPYSELFGDKTGEAIGSSIFIIIILTLLLNGTSMMYATVFTCSLMLGKVYSTIKLYLRWKSYGYFRFWS
jgi:protective antigen spaA homolog